MLIAICLLAIAVVGCCTVQLYLLRENRRRLESAPLDHLASLVRLRLVVHTKDDRSIRGVLIADYPDCILLDAPEYLGEPQVQELAGRAVILRPNLAWIQVLSDDGS